VHVFRTKFWHQKSQSCVKGLKFFAKNARKMLMKLSTDIPCGNLTSLILAWPLKKIEPTLVGNPEIINKNPKKFSQVQITMHLLHSVFKVSTLAAISM